MIKKIPTYSICNLLGADRCMSEFVITRLRDFVTSHRDLYFPHRHDFYQIVLFTQGGGRHSIDFQQYEVEPDQVYCMAPGQIHTWEFDAETDGYLLNFHESFFASVFQNPHYVREFSLFNHISKPSVYTLAANTSADIALLFSRMLEEFDGNYEYKIEMLRSMLLQTLVQISRIMPGTYAADVPKHNLVLMRQFEKLVEMHFHEKRLPKEYAELLFVSPNHLNALSNAIIGKSAGDLIRERVLLEIKRLLVNSDLLIGQIADHLNFEDNAYFARFFKKYTGITPETFRTDYTNNGSLGLKIKTDFYG
jgi:AraC-like DNA-binding protein